MQYLRITACILDKLLSGEYETNEIVPYELSRRSIPNVLDDNHAEVVLTMNKGTYYMTYRIDRTIETNYGYGVDPRQMAILAEKVDVLLARDERSLS